MDRMKRFVKPPPVERVKDQYVESLLSKILFTTGLALLFGISVEIYHSDIKTVGMLFLGLIVLFVPYSLLRRGQVNFASTSYSLIVIATLTGSATAGQGIHDITIVAFPIIYFFASMSLNRIVFRVCLASTLLAIFWLTFGELYGWFVPQPSSPTHWMDFAIVAFVLMIAAFASRLLATSLNKNLKLAEHEIVRRSAMEEAMLEERALLETTLESTADGILVIDMDGSWYRFNQKFLDLWKISTTNKESLTDQTSFELLVKQLSHPNEFNAMFQSLQSNMESQTLDIIELIDGRFFECISMPHFLEKQVIGRVWTFRDITERKQVDEVLRENEEHFRSIFENATIGMYRTTPDGQIILANTSLIQMLGYTSLEELTNRDLNSEGFEQKGDREEFLRRIESERNIQGLESVWERRDGQKIFVSESASVICDKDGNTLFYEGTVEDITKRKQAEEELAQSEQDYRGLFDMAHDAIILFEEKDEIVVEANQRACDLYGYSREEFIGMSLNNISTDKELGKKRVKEVLGKGHIKQFEILQKRRDGSKLYVEVNASRTVYKGKTVILSLNHDITKRKRAEKKRLALEVQLQHSQNLEAIGTMVSGISHEFNNVLQSMFLYADLVQDKLPEDEALRSDFAHIVADGNRARDLIKQILTFSRKSKVDMKPEFLHHLILDSLKLEQASLPENIELKQEIDMNCGLVMCNPSQVSQIMMNMCTNAQHAMTQNGGTLKVELKQTRATIKKGDPEIDVLALKVSDTGHGIEESDLKRIFDPFYTTKQFGKGSGLGLSVIHGIVEMMAGQISVTSKIGQGATFLILFPVTNETELDSKVVAAGQAEMKYQSILLVDDEPSILKATKAALSRKGLSVQIASDGKHALDLFKANPENFDLIVTDQSMPRMSGVDLIKEIRALPSDIPIIFSTGHLGLSNEKEFGDIGITSILRKPWSAKELLAQIQKLDAG